ncbi:MAG: SIMPL domain-containing protein [Candidatus Roizmanbacteria bacterium]|nr:SIMPL domain-containing protein [Candidatus Roizmanbacteria bacterium]
MENKNFLGNFIAVVFIALVALYLVKVFNISYPLTVVTTSKSTELAVVGEGKVEVTPDTAYVDAGISVDRASSVEEAQKTINKINNKIINALRDIGIEKADIKTSNYSIYPSYKYENNENKLDGYNGNATIQIKVRDPQLASKVIETATTAGANQIQGSRFVVDKPELYREEAREKAIKNAKEQAEKMAKNLGIKLGKITNIVESIPNQPVLYKTMMAEGIGAGGGGSANIEPGSQTITSVVTLYFEKK